MIFDLLPHPKPHLICNTSVYSAPLTFDGALPLGDYLFAAADDGNGIFERGKGIADEVSPKTSSAVVTPEPATIALLGIGLAGIAGGAARRKLKKKAVENS